MTVSQPRIALPKTPTMHLSDTFADAIKDYTEGVNDRLSIKDIISNALQGNPECKTTQRAVANILRRLGFVNYKARINGVSKRVWFRQGSAS